MNLSSFRQTGVFVGQGSSNQIISFLSTFVMLLRQQTREIESVNPFFKSSVVLQLEVYA